MSEVFIVGVDLAKRVFQVHGATATGDRAALDTILFGIFDWYPFAQYMAQNLFSVRQDVSAMLDAMFKVIDSERPYPPEVIQIAPIVLADGTDLRTP